MQVPSLTANDRHAALLSELLAWPRAGLASHPLLSPLAPAGHARTVVVTVGAATAEAAAAAAGAGDMALEPAAVACCG